jgi:hypothetical protein
MLGAMISRNRDHFFAVKPITNTFFSVAAGFFLFGFPGAANVFAIIALLGKNPKII